MVDSNAQTTLMPQDQPSAEPQGITLGPIPPEVREYLESLLQDAGMEGFDREMHESIINELYIRLDKFLIGKVITYLPNEKLDEFVKLNEETGDPQKIQDYLTQNLPNVQEIFTIAFEEFRKVYLEAVTNAKSQTTVNSQT